MCKLVEGLLIKTVTFFQDESHSSFVANKLGLEHLILLNYRKTIRLNDLKDDTQKFKAILVEGDSDELIVQKAFRVNNSDTLPIEKGIDIISVGTSFLRFLEFVKKYPIDVKNVLYMGDDFSDSPVLKKMGIPCCPADAIPKIFLINSNISPLKGSVREVIQKAFQMQEKCSVLNLNLTICK